MIVERLLKELEKFPDREKDLRNIKRYSLYHTMWYRTDLWIHSRRLAWIVEEVAPFIRKVFGSSFDSTKALALALVHDDPEIIIGDIQAGNKAKMSEQELAEIKKLGINAIEELSASYPETLDKYNYKSLLIDASEKKSLEAIVVSFFDKYDAFCEALHELYACNKLWTKNVNNEYGEIMLPTDYYMDYFNSYIEKFPQTKELFLQNNDYFKIPENPDILKIVDTNTKHTKQSIHNAKGYKPYDQWVQLTIKNGTGEDIRNLYKNKE